jgi:hypothetical protein
MEAGSSTCPSIRDGGPESVGSAGDVGPKRDLKQHGPLIPMPARWLESTPFSSSQDIILARRHRQGPALTASTYGAA